GARLGPGGDGGEDPGDRRRSADRLRRPHRDDQERRRRRVRRAARRPYRVREGRGPDPGARQRAGARGRLHRGRANDPPAPGVRGGRHGGRPGRRRLADSRLDDAGAYPPLTIERPVFFYDVGSPWCWLAAEQVNAVLDPVPEWIPVSAVPGPDVDRREIERRADELGLPEV